MVTQERLKEVLAYEADTGLFRWRERAGRAIVGQVAGGIRERGYRVIRVDGVLYRAHRLAFLYVYGCWPSHGIDHINGRTDDNRLANLREASASINAQNVVDYQTTGVERRPSGSFRAVLKLAGRKLHVGTFATEAEAKAAYLEAKRQRHPGYVEGRRSTLAVPQ
jgi:HNH endonuclease